MNGTYESDTGTAPLGNENFCHITGATHTAPDTRSLPPNGNIIGILTLFRDLN